jgi:catechol 2,3-dioxygenase-like lactoylglutathione lyase family enzyme
MSAGEGSRVAERGIAPGQVIGLDHVVVVVADLDAAVERYAGVFGNPSAVLGGAEVGYRRAMFELGDSGQRIELCQPLGVDEPGGQSQASRAFRRRLDEVGEGVHNVAVLVRDVPAARSVADDVGVRVIQSRHSDTFFLHPQDMSGALLQFMPPEPGAPQAVEPVS